MSQAQSQVVDVDFLVIGAGPAGLQLGYCLEKAGLDYLILEAGQRPGTFFEQFPRHRKLISINKIYTGYDDYEINMRWDWNSLLSDSEDMLFKHYSKRYFPPASDLLRYLHDFSTRYELRVKCRTQVVSVAKAGEGFDVADDAGVHYKAACVVVASGLPKPYIPPIEGVDLTETYHDMSVDPNDFINQRVLIIGKGNSGFETADNLMETSALMHLVSPTPINMAWRSKHVGHLRAINMNMLDTYQLKSQNVILDAEVKRIARDEDGTYHVSYHYSHAEGEEETLCYDRVLLCTGFRFDHDIFADDCKPELCIDDRFPKQTSSWESTNVKGLYFGGILMQMRDFKKKQSAFIHGFRYNMIALFHIINERFKGRPLPYRDYAHEPAAMAEAVIDRVNRTSGLWQQTGFLCDVMVVTEDGKGVRYYDDFPIDFAHDHFGREACYYLISLEFGLETFATSPDPFALNRIHKDNHEASERSSGIHPIVRKFRKREQLSEHHVIEDIASEWKEDVHVLPLKDYFKKEANVLTSVS